MTKYLFRRLLSVIPTLLFISLAIFAILDLAPNDPTSTLPPTLPPEYRELVRESLGLNQPFHFRYTKWLQQFCINEPLNLIESALHGDTGNSTNRLRVRSWITKGPVVDLIRERLPQTLWVSGSAFLLTVVLAIPIGIISAYKQYSIFDQVGTFLALIGFSVPTFFTGLMAILIFSAKLKWFPSIYNTTHEVIDFPSLVVQLRQMVLPITIITFYSTAGLSRYTRAAVLDNLNLDYVRTARSKGLSEGSVIIVHVLRNSLIPVVTLLALSVPSIFTGAIITEQIFRINGLGALLVQSIQGADIPLAQTLTFISAILIVFANLMADIVYGILDPRIRYD